MNVTMHSSQPIEDFFQRLESFNGRNEQLVSDRTYVGSSYSIGGNYSDCPNHVEGAQLNVSTALEINGSRPLPSPPASLPPTSSDYPSSSQGQSFPSHFVYRSHLPTLLPACDTQLVLAHSMRTYCTDFHKSALFAVRLSIFYQRFRAVPR